VAVFPEIPGTNEGIGKGWGNDRAVPDYKPRRWFRCGEFTNRRDETHPGRRPHMILSTNVPPRVKEARLARKWAARFSSCSRVPPPMWQVM